MRNVRVRCDRLYNELHAQGFEFTHHNPIDNEAHRDSFRRKVARLDQLRGRGNLCFLYHYRINAHRDVDRIIDKAATFARLYSAGDRHCRVIVFTQNIVSSSEDRAVVEVANTQLVSAYALNTLAMWRGDDQDIFWARNDDDLFAQMFRLVKLKGR